MTTAIHNPEGEPLPETLAIFPLGGALLLPHAKLPLNIFEPRYLNMTEDALGGDRLIGMIQPRRPFEHPVPNDAALYDIGCVGRITSFSEAGDGRYLLTLTGVSRFAVNRELPMVRGYRRVSASYGRFVGDREGDGGTNRRSAPAAHRRQSPLREGRHASRLAVPAGGARRYPWSAPWPWSVRWRPARSRPCSNAPAWPSGATF